MPDILGNLIRRIDALEAAVHGRASDFFDRKLTKPMVALREAKSARQIERDVENRAYPPPDEIINGRWYWWLSTLERHDRERLPVADIADEVGPISGAATIGLCTAPALALGRSAVAEVPHQQLDQLRDQRPRLVVGNQGEIFPLDLPRFAAMPAVGLPGVGVDAEGGELLPIAQKFELLGLLGAAIGRHQSDEDLRERRIGTEQDRALGRQADAHEDGAALLKAPAHQVFGGTRSFFVEDIEIERWRCPGEDSGIDSVRPGSLPQGQHFVRDGAELLPAGQSLA